MLALMRDSGCQQILIGLESPRRHSLQGIERVSNWKARQLDLPLNRLVDRLAELPTDRPLVLNCRTGYRSSLAASLLAGAGFTAVFDLVGGIEAWRASQLPMVESGAAACATS